MIHMKFASRKILNFQIIISTHHVLTYDKDTGITTVIRKS